MSVIESFVFLICPRRWRLRRGLILRSIILPMLAFSTTLLAETPAWPPRIDQRNTLTHLGTRKVLRFLHGTRAEWGYDRDQEDYFFVVEPKDTFLLKGKSIHPKPNTPLFVFLHSAGHEGLTGMLYGYLPGQNGGYETAISHAPEDFYGLYLDCHTNDGTDWWWGWQTIDYHRGKYLAEMTPTEKRVIDTVEWVIKQYSIDPNRVYLAGLSMGGSGSLGIGLIRGDIFAAISVRVPAGTGHLQTRTHWGAELPPNAPPERTEAWLKTVSGFGRPDPPVLVDVSSQTDDYSKGQDILLSAARDGHNPVVFGWGPFGHTGQDPELIKSTPAVMEFPWLEIKRNEAYAVFTRASSDQKAPWLNPADSDASGQINAFFRWKSIEDTPMSVTMELRLARRDEFTRPIEVPKQSVADVTLRRLQMFKVVAGTTYSWKLIRNQKVYLSGSIKPDAANLLTIPKVLVTDTPAQLRLTPDSSGQ